MLDVFLPAAQEIAGQFHRRLDFVQFAVEDADGFAGHLVFGEPQFHQAHFGALERQFGGADVGGDGVGFEDRHRVLFDRHALAEDGVMHLGCERRAGRRDPAAGLADGERFVERFLDRGGRAADDDEVAAAADGAGLDHGDGGLLQQRVGAVDAVGDAAELDDRDGGIFPHQTILNAPTSVQRRQREKLRGLVMPSPVGLAMVNEV